MPPKKELPSLVKALDFIALAQKDKGAPYQTHVCLEDNFAAAYDGVLAAGHRIEEDLRACPNTMMLVAALKKCTAALSVTQLDSGRLSVKSGKFRALIPCSDSAVISTVYPDDRCGRLDNRIKTALATVSPLIVENSQRVITAACLLRSGSVIATNGHLLLEYWHGIDLPPGLIIPKLFINALLKVDKKLAAFGYSATSFTVYFEDDSWLRTQLYSEQWPDCDAILKRAHTAVPLPDDFFKAFNTILPFIEDGRVKLRPGRLQTHMDDSEGASYELDGIGGDMMFNAKNIKLLDGLIKTIDFVGNNNVSYFYGDNLRGAISQIRI